MLWPNFRRVLGAIMLLVLVACGEEGPKELRILAGSENATLEPIVRAYCDDQGWQCPMTYRGSVDIKLALEEPDLPFDAVWPAHSRWIDLGDHSRRLKHQTSILTSPVVLAVRRSVAQELALVDRAVSTPELVELVRAGRFKFIATSATQSNSGFSFYIAMLTALSGAKDVLVPDDLAGEQARANARTFLGGVVRTASSSSWLKDLYLDAAASQPFQAMVNYEALVIEANQELERRGLEPLYAIYPSDGVAVADSPLGFVAQAGEGGSAKEEFFREFQAHLLSPEVQGELMARGRRTGFGGTLEGFDSQVFRSDWGIDPTRVLPAIRFPAADTIEQALALYQEVLRKPSALGLCLDFSGSMADSGEAELKSALAALFDPTTARRFLIQPTQADLFMVLPFSGKPWLDRLMAAHGNEVAPVPAAVNALVAEGGTDIYACAQALVERLAAAPEARTHALAVVLMTDGRSQGDPESFTAYWREAGQGIPVFAITFGDADPEQLEALAQLTRARVFDGRKDLAAAFRTARGYN